MCHEGALKKTAGVFEKQRNILLGNPHCNMDGTKYFIMVSVLIKFMAKKFPAKFPKI